jgi:TonB family protein
MKTFSKIALAVAILFSANAAFGQAEGGGELQRAIGLYRQGSYEQAIGVLEGLSKKKGVKDEETVLNYLGLAYLEKNELKKARKALEKAVALAPQNAVLRTNLAFALLRSNKPKEARREAEQSIALDAKLFMSYFIRGTSFLWTGDFDEAVADADRTIGFNAAFAPAYMLKADTFVAQFGSRISDGSTGGEQAGLLSKAVEALEACRKKCTNNAEVQAQNEKLESFKVFYAYFSREKSNAASVATDPNVVPIKIDYKPRASYTDQARNAMVSGRIVLAVMFSASGKVTDIIVVKPLGYGLDQEAIKAARGIRFSPLIRDGKPVSVVKTVEYSFSIGGR